MYLYKKRRHTTQRGQKTKYKTKGWSTSNAKIQTKSYVQRMIREFIQWNVQCGGLHVDSDHVVVMTVMIVIVVSGCKVTDSIHFGDFQLYTSSWANGNSRILFLTCYPLPLWCFLLLEMQGIQLCKISIPPNSEIISVITSSSWQCQNHTGHPLWRSAYLGSEVNLFELWQQDLVQHQDWHSCLGEHSCCLLR